jgi:bisphosphoglycerate-independent phosphoglycerate mutase (AlkP superfamily)
MTGRANGAPLLLAILDGFGEAPPGPGNAITLAEPRTLLDLRQKWPVGFLQASGEDVGLPCGLMGNSEVGHLNIGAGRRPTRCGPAARCTCSASSPTAACTAATST